MTREKKKFRPGKELKEVFDEIDRRRDSARQKFIARKQGLEAKKRAKELKDDEQVQSTDNRKNRKSRLKQDPSKVAEQSKEIMGSVKTE